MPEAWCVTIYPDEEKLAEVGISGDWGPPTVTGTGATPEAARADARKRLAAWMEALALLEEAERQ